MQFEKFEASRLVNVPLVQIGRSTIGKECYKCASVKAELHDNCITWKEMQAGLKMSVLWIFPAYYDSNSDLHAIFSSSFYADGLYKFPSKVNPIL